MNTSSRLRPWRVVVCFCVLGVVLGATLARAFAAEFQNDKEPIYFAHSNCVASLRQIADSEGGVYALMLAITNLSTNSVTLKVTDVPSFTVRLRVSVGPDKDGQLEKPAPHFHAFELHRVEMPIQPQNHTFWFIPIADYLQDPKRLPDRTNATIAVTFFAYVKVEGVDSWQDAGLQFFRTGVPLRRQSLEGRAADKYLMQRFQPASADRLLFNLAQPPASLRDELLKRGFSGDSGRFERNQWTLGEAQTVLGFQKSEMRALPNQNGVLISDPEWSYDVDFKNARCLITVKMVKGQLQDASTVRVIVNTNSLIQDSRRMTFKGMSDYRPLCNLDPVQPQPPWSLRHALLERGFSDEGSGLFERKQWTLGEAQTALGFGLRDVHPIPSQDSSSTDLESGYYVMFWDGRCVLTVKGQEILQESTPVSVTVTTNLPNSRRFVPR
jgi:hypothetical protein